MTASTNFPSVNFVTTHSTFQAQRLHSMVEELGHQIEGLSRPMNYLKVWLGLLKPNVPSGPLVVPPREQDESAWALTQMYNDSRRVLARLATPSIANLVGLLRESIERRAPGLVQRLPGFVPVLRWWSRRNLSLLHQVLHSQNLAENCWLHSGTLLACVREGRLMTHDLFDFDFSLLEEHEPLLRNGIEQLEQSGFRLREICLANSGRATVYVFRKGPIRYDFHITRVEDGEKILNTWFGWSRFFFVQVTTRLTYAGSRTCQFLGNAWMIPANAEQQLQEIYGQWQVPMKSWDATREDRSIFERKYWGNASRRMPTRPNRIETLAEATVL
jgi:hypothetical protein